MQRLSAALSDRYTIERELGQGGMATVYLAHDVRHDRKVALKVLRPELAAILGGERFLKEIRLTANLQHPHILSLFDSGEADGIVYYVMPYVEGESLRDRLNREKQLPVEDAVRITREVAGALDYAHRHGIVHRDIKPENILLHDGSALVADFGIALAVSRSDGGSRMTETGMSLGTPHYMAPEQAMGEREITPKADIYALGCVLYEMLTGEPPYTGPTAQAIIARVMTEQPRSVTMQRHTVPAHVDAVVRTALEKLPADRFSTAAEFAAALEDRSFTSSSTPGTSAALAGGARRSRLVPALAAVAIAALGLAGWSLLRPQAAVPVRPLVRFGIQLPRDAAPTGATGSTIAFSPDGSRLVYVGTGPRGNRLYSRGLDQLDPVPIPGSEGGSLPFFSDDRHWIGFKQNRRIVKVAIVGGPVTTVCDAPGNTFGATWTAADTIIFASDSGLMIVPATGGQARLLARPDSGESFLWPDALPGERYVLFTIARDGVKLAALDRRTGAVKRLNQSGGYPMYVSAGFVVLTDPSGIVSAVPFDARRLEVTGSAMQLADKLSASLAGDRNLGVARSGDFAYQTTPSAGSRLVLVDRSGASRDAGLDTGYYGTPRFAPDGKRIAMSRFVDINFTAQDIWVADLEQHTRTRLTFDTTASSPVWSPDGRRIAYSHAVSSAGGFESRVYWVPSDGSGAPESLTTARGSWGPTAFEPSGRGIVYHGLPTQLAKPGIWQIGLTGARTPQQLLATSFANFAATLSPDGRWMAYSSDESGRLEVYVRPYPGPGGRWQVSLDGGSEPIWSPTGREIFYRIGDRMMAATIRTQGGVQVASRTVLFSGPYDANVPSHNYDVSRDGKTFALFQQVQGADQSVFVTLNWFDQHRGAAGQR